MSFLIIINLGIYFSFPFLQLYAINRRGPSRRVVIGGVRVNRPEKRTGDTGNAKCFPQNSLKMYNIIFFFKKKKIFELVSVSEGDMETEAVLLLAVGAGGAVVVLLAAAAVILHRRKVRGDNSPCMKKR